MIKKYRFLIYPFFISIFLIFFIINKIHPSSLGIYHQFFNGSKKDKNLIFGQPRAIRSDEWLVGTPKIIAQVKAGFPVVNKNIGFKEVMPSQGCLPYNHWRVIFCPNMWGFFFLPIEVGYSFSWWSIVFIMLTASYFLLLKLTKSYLISILGSLSFFFTPFNQWWSYPLSSYVGYGSLITLFVLKIFESKKLLGKIIYTLFFCYFLLVFAFIQYPPFQIASFYVFLGIILGYLINKRLLTKKNLISFILIFLSVLVSFLVIYLFYKEFKSTIDIIVGTEYPGKRVSSGKGFNLLHLFNGFYNIQLQDDIKGQSLLVNQSEASNFFLLSIFALPYFLHQIIIQIKKKKLDFIFLFLNLLMMICFFYMVFGLPIFFSKITFLFLVPSKRMLIGLGLANMFLIFYFLILKKFKSRFDDKLIIFLSFIIFTVNFYLGLKYKILYPNFIQNELKIFLISLISAILLYTFLKQRIYIFLFLFFTFSFISTYKVNPLYSGLDPLINTPFSKKIVEISRKEGKDKYWVNLSSIYLENYFAANGLRQLGGVHYYPQFEIWKKIDEDGKYKKIYNRYAHVSFFDNKNIKDKFILYQLDHFGVNLNFIKNNIYFKDKIIINQD